MGLCPQPVVLGVVAVERVRRGVHGDWNLLSCVGSVWPRVRGVRGYRGAGECAARRWTSSAIGSARSATPGPPRGNRSRPNSPTRLISTPAAPSRPGSHRPRRRPRRRRQHAEPARRRGSGQAGDLNAGLHVIAGCGSQSTASTPRPCPRRLRECPPRTAPVASTAARGCYRSLPWVSTRVWGSGCS